MPLDRPKPGVFPNEAVGSQSELVGCWDCSNSYLAIVSTLVYPPSTTTTEPLTNAASGPMRNATTEATSSGSPEPA